ncbi:AAA family ATPase [Lamprobacter modestohalophilus]|nr:DUF3696 domain-containing protein [Lamprobacter modestohalophilus]
MPEPKMFTHLHLKHFKAWRAPVDVDLKDVTVLLGTNSSGKSSLLQALLLLKQTAASPDRTVHLNLGGDESNDDFGFGAFEDVLSAGATPRQFEIGFHYRRLDNGSPQGGKPSRALAGEFLATYGMNSAKAAVVQSLRLTSAAQTYRVVRRERGAYSVLMGDETQPRAKGRACSPERSIALSADAIAALGLDGTLAEDISLSIRRELEQIAYLGPLRRPPQRDYVWNKTRPGVMEPDGNRVVDLLFSSAFSRSKQTEDCCIIDEVSTWLNRMGLAERLEPIQVGRSTRYEIVVHRDGVAANLRDVGIGISQVLPVLALAFFAPVGATIILEEPEIHLHPLAQSVLAELFVEVSRQRRVQFIIETHSEHLFRRLQTLIAKQETTADQCRLYFVDRQGPDAALQSLELDEFGRISHWPDKFFGDALGETREQARLMFERLQRQQAEGAEHA